MNRKSLAMQAGIAQAAQGFIKEIQRLRKEHGFGSVDVEIDSPLAGNAKVSIEIHSMTDFEFNGDGEFVLEEWVEKDLAGARSEIAAQEP